MTKQEFKICFDQWFDPIRNYIYYRCGDVEKATDVAQEAFMKVWEKSVDYHPQKTKALLYTVARNLWISQYRKMETARKYRLNFDYTYEPEGPQHKLEYEELKGKYEIALANLPEKQRTVFLMNRLEDFTYKEIAERLDIGLKAVEKRMSLALHSLRKELGYGK